MLGIPSPLQSTSPAYYQVWCGWPFQLLLGPDFVLAQSQDLFNAKKLDVFLCDLEQGKDVLSITLKVVTKCN